MELINNKIGLVKKIKYDQNLYLKKNNYYKQFKKGELSDVNAEIHTYENENGKGWVLIEYLEENNLKKYKMTDYGNEGRSTEWKVLITPS